MIEESAHLRTALAPPIAPPPSHAVDPRLNRKQYERSLRQAVAAAEGGRFTPAKARKMAASLFRTLRQLHEAGVVVRDIKPENILLDTYDDPVIADFGVSDIMRTQTRVVPTAAKGTFNYMSPEAFECGDMADGGSGGLGPPADVWAMTCVVVEMLSGAPPWFSMQLQVCRARPLSVRH